MAHSTVKRSLILLLPGSTLLVVTVLVSHLINVPNTAASKPVNNSHLQSVVDAWAAHQPFQTSVAVQELTGSIQSARYNAGRQAVTASVYKLFVAYAVLHHMEQGKLTNSTVLTSGQTVQEALSAMITNSDNASAESLGFKVGWQHISNLAVGLGATHTNINNYAADGSYTAANKVTTANDVSLLLTKLYNGTLLSQYHTQLLIGLLGHQVWRERIPAGIPAGITVADKPGWLAPADGYNGYVQNDAAIVYGPKSRYVLVVLTSGSTPQPLTELSRAVYTAIQAN